MSEHILNGIREAWIHYLDPTQLSDDPLQGLAEKEALLKQLDPCFLREVIPGYDELEDLIDKTIGSSRNQLTLLDQLINNLLFNPYPNIKSEVKLFREVTLRS